MNAFPTILALWNLGWTEVVIILVAVLLLFGGNKIPELARGLARGLKSFKHEMRDVQHSLDDETSAENTERKPPVDDSSKEA